jgi:hypothetical protein
MVFVFGLAGLAGWLAGLACWMALFAVFLGWLGSSGWVAEFAA